MVQMDSFEHKLDAYITRQVDIKDGVTRKALHLLITGKCNSNCIFCFSRKELRREHFPINSVDEIVKKHFDLGYEILVLSGGEPTIHPEFIKIISNAKSLGYKQIKVITNGRMFSYKRFLSDSIEAGLNGVTISIHSHIPKIQDYLSGVKNGFEQTLDGIKNCLDLGVDIKINIVVNKRNIRELRESLSFFKDIGIKKIGLLRIMPYGQAWKNKENLFYNHNDNIGYLEDALEFAERNGIEIWANRFDLRLFGNYPKFMQNPIKFPNEVESKIGEFQDLIKNGKELFCYPERCSYCFFEDFCRELREEIKIGKCNRLYVNGNGLMDPIKFAKFYAERFVK